MELTYGWSTPPKEVMENYINKCKLFVEDNEAFKKFKQDPDYQKILEGNEIDVGWGNFYEIEDQAFLIKNLEFFKENENVGNPQIYNFEGIGEIAPSTLRYANTALKIRKFLGNYKPKTIAELGGGYGGLCKMLDVIYDFESYIQVDIPPAIALCKKYLNCFPKLSPKISYFSCEDIDLIPQVDLFIADSSIAECDIKTQLKYAKKMASSANYIYILYNTLHLPQGILNFHEVLDVFSDFNFEREDRNGCIILYLKRLIPHS